MLGILFILLFTIYLIFFHPIIKPKQEEEQHSPKYSMQMKKLWSIAQTSMKERKPLRAEKALLTILKFDEKNAAAYNRLGILYAKEQKYDEAIECFEIAQSLDNNASSLHNVGLIYLETGAYEKAVMAFEQALKLEGDLPARYIALAKAEEKLGNRKAAIDALEAAFDLEASTSTLRHLLAIYENAGDEENVVATTARIEAQIAADAKKRADAALKRKVASRRSSTGVSTHPRQAKPTARVLYPSKTRTPAPKPGTGTTRPTTASRPARKRRLIQ